MTRTPRMAVLSAGLAILAAGARAEAPTPLETLPPPGETATIACAPGEHIDTSSDLVRALYHYRLYLPRDYGDSDRRYPAMFLASPSGNADMGALAGPLTEDRWIVAMLVESRNGSPDWLPNFECAFDDLMTRTRALPGMAFCSGLSGAARVCSAYPALRPGFRGMILQSAGPWGGRGFMTAGNEDMVIYGAFGALDFNFHHARRMRLFLPGRVARSVTIFDGGHEWAPAPVMRGALDWVLEKALAARPYDPALADGYRWYFANRLARQARLATDIERYAEYMALRALPASWRFTPDADEAAALARMAAAAEAWAASPAFAAEHAAWRAWAAARAADDASRGRDLPEIAEAYAAVAAAHPGAAFGARAAARGRSVRWETGVYP